MNVKIENRIDTTVTVSTSGENNQPANEASTTATTTATTASTTASTTAITPSNEELIDNSTTFNQLLRILAANPDVVANAKTEAEEKAAEEKEAKLHASLGEDYDLVFDQKKANKDKPRRPGAVQLRTSVPRIAAIDIGHNGICEVFSNGYAVYDNGNRKVVIWVPDCGAVTYYFTPLNANEKLYMSQSEEIGADVMGELPWYNALMIAGENRIEYNMDHPKSKGSSSDFDLEEDVIPATSWVGGCHFDDPETAYLKKEAAEERRKVLTEKQRVVYEMYFERGMTTREIADDLMIQHPAVVKMVARIRERIK